MSEKQKTVLEISILVVVVVGICFGSILAVDLFMSKNNQEDPVPTKSPVPAESSIPSESPVVTESPLPIEEEEKEISMELAEELFEMIRISYCGTGFYSHYGKEKLLANDFTNEQKNAIVIINLNEKKQAIGKTSDGNPKYTKEQIMNVKNQIFGKDTSFQITEEKTCYQFYIDKDGNYIAQINGCADICMASELHKTISATQIDNKISFEQAIIFIDYVYEKNETVTMYYGDWEKTNLLYKEDSSSTSSINFEKYQDQTSIYRYTYQDNSDGTYTFLEMKKIK